MLDWLASKVAMTLAAVLLLSSSVGVFVWQGDDASRRSLAGSVEDVRRALDAISSLHGEGTFVVSLGSVFGAAPPGASGGDVCVWDLGRIAVLASCGSLHASSPLAVPVHLFAPVRRSFSSAELQELDEAHATIRVTSPRTLEILRWRIEIDRAPGYATFVVLPES